MPTNVTTEFGAYHLADNPSQYQPVRVNNFRLLVQGIDDLIYVGGDDGEETDHIYNGQEVIDFSVIKFDAPHFSQDNIQISRGNSTINFAGKAKFDTNTLEINDFAGANGKSVLEAWQALSYDVINDTIASSDKYKKNAIVIEYLPDNTMLRYWELIGCWVSKLSESGWDNENSGKKTVTATITYDRAIPHLAD